MLSLRWVRMSATPAAPRGGPCEEAEGQLLCRQVSAADSNPLPSHRHGSAASRRCSSAWYAALTTPPLGPIAVRSSCVWGLLTFVASIISRLRSSEITEAARPTSGGPFCLSANSRRRSFRFHAPAPLGGSLDTDERARADLHYGRALPDVQQIVESCARYAVIRTKLLNSRGLPARNYWIDCAHACLS